VDPDQAETSMRELVRTAVFRQEFRTASVAAGELANPVRLTADPPRTGAHSP